MRDLVVKPRLTHATVPFACKAKCISFRCRSQADAKRGFGRTIHLTELADDHNRTAAIRESGEPASLHHEPSRQTERMH